MCGYLVLSDLSIILKVGLICFYIKHLMLVVTRLLSLSKANFEPTVDAATAVHSHGFEQIEHFNN